MPLAAVFRPILQLPLALVVKLVLLTEQSPAALGARVPLKFVVMGDSIEIDVLGKKVARFHERVGFIDFNCLRVRLDERVCPAH